MKTLTKLNGQIHWISQKIKVRLYLKSVRLIVSSKKNKEKYFEFNSEVYNHSKRILQISGWKPLSEYNDYLPEEKLEA
jgi:hypothetical protein